MKTPGRIGGAVLVLALIVVAWIGSVSPTGRTIWGGFWQGVNAILTFIGDQAARLDGTAVAGNVWAAVGIAAVLFLLTLALVPGLRVGRGFAMLAVVFTALAFVLYQPSILAGVGA